MNCLTAREILDFVRLHEGVPDEVPARDAGDDELQAATVDDAVWHVTGCPACQTVVRRREQIDSRIGQLSRDVPVPAGLRKRLLARIFDDQFSREGPAVEQPAPAIAVTRHATQDPQAPEPRERESREKTVQPPSRSRRRLLVSVVAACAVVSVAMLGVRQWMVSRPALLTQEEIAQYALSEDLNPKDLPEFTKFEGGQAVQPAKTMTPLRMHPLRRLVDPNLGGREIAVYFFSFPRPRGGKFEGRLIVVRAAAVKDLPAALSFPGLTEYKLGYCTTAWVEGNFLYLCCVRGGEDELHSLRPSRAASA